MMNDRLAKLDPDFQRGRVWSDEQQIKFVETILRGGGTALGINILRFNCVGWQDDYKGPFVIVDGLQRLTSAIRFLKNEIPAFGYYYNEFEGRLPSYAEFIVQINNLKRRKDVLKWYLEINSNGMVHSEEELIRVQKLLENED
jgi:hypothetical protein